MTTALILAALLLIGIIAIGFIAVVFRIGEPLIDKDD